MTKNIKYYIYNKQLMAVTGDEPREIFSNTLIDLNGMIDLGVNRCCYYGSIAHMNCEPISNIVAKKLIKLCIK